MSHFSRLPSEVSTNAPLRVPTRTRTWLMLRFFFLFYFILFAPIRSLQALDVNLSHLQHSFEDPLRFGRVFVLHQFDQSPGDDLPRYAKFVFQPGALQL